MSQPIWGINPVLEALKNNPDFIEEIWIEKKTLKGKKYQILEKAKKLNIPVKLVSQKEFIPPKIGKNINTQGVVAYISRFCYSDLEDVVKNWEEKNEIPLVVMLDEVEDPQNLGSIIRIADAAGVHGVIIPKMRSCDITGTVIKVSSGSVFNIPIVKVTNLKHAIKFFKDKGLWIIGLSPHTDQSLYKLDLKIPIVFIAGNEARGIKKSILEECDWKVKIPMKGKIESLNVAIALAISLFETLRQRFYS